MSSDLVPQRPANLAPRSIQHDAFLPAITSGSDSLGVDSSRGATDPCAMARFTGGEPLVLSEQERSALMAPLTEEEVTCDTVGDTARLDATGRPILYMSHPHVRMRLLKAFGPGGWAMVPVSPPSIRVHSEKQAVVCQTWDLYVRGRFAARATGEMVYNPTNMRMTEADSIEGAKSNALTRCAKDFGIGLELFTKSGREKFRKGGPSVPVLPPPQRMSAKPTVAPVTAAAAIAIVQATTSPSVPVQSPTSAPKGA